MLSQSQGTDVTGQARPAATGGHEAARPGRSTWRAGYSVSLSCLKDVASARDRFDPRFVGDRDSELLAQPVDPELQIGGAGTLVPPGVLDQPTVRDDPPLIREQEMEQAELQRRQLNRQAIHVHLTAQHVEFKVTGF